jgi:hypothetical protein
VKLRSPIAVLAQLAALALAVAALTGCQTNVGAAAHVDDQTITVRDLDDRISGLSDDELAALGETDDAITSFNRNLVLTFSIREKVFERVWEERGGLPSQEELDALHDRAVQFLFNSPAVAPGAGGDETVRAALAQTGIDEGFGAVMVRAAALELALSDDITPADESAAVEAVREAGVEVRVNKRFGAWDEEALAVGQRSFPEYLQFDGSAAPVA